MVSRSVPVKFCGICFDLRSPLRAGAYDSRFTHGVEAQKPWLSSLNSREFSHAVQDYNYRAFQATSKGIASGAKWGISDVLGVNLMHENLKRREAAQTVKGRGGLLRRPATITGLLISVVASLVFLADRLADFSATSGQKDFIDNISSISFSTDSE